MDKNFNANLIVNLINRNSQQIQQLKNDLSGVTNAGNDTKQAMNGINQALNVLKAVIPLALIKEFVSTLSDWAEQGAKLEDVQAAFNRRFGEGEDIIQKLRDAAHGTIDDFDLMAAANRASIEDVTSNVDQLASILEYARIKARETGQDSTQVFTTLTEGIGRGNARILKTLGIDIPESFKKTFDSLDLVQQKQILLDQVMQASSDIVSQTGGDVQTVSERMQSWGVTLTDLKDKVGEFVANGVVQLQDKLDPLVQQIKGPLTDAFNKAKQIIEPFVTLFNQVSSAVGGFISQHINTAIDSIKKSFENSGPTFQKIAVDIAKLIGKAEELGGKIGSVLGPIIQDVWNSILKPAFDWLSDNAGPILEQVINLIGSILDWLVQAYNTVSPVIDKIISFTKVAFEDLKNIISGVWNFILGVFQTGVDAWNHLIVPLVEIFAKVIGGIFEGVKEEIARVWNAIRPIVQPIIDWFNANVAPQLGAFANTVSAIWNAMKAVATAAWGSLGGIVKSAINGVIDQINNFITQVDSVLWQLQQSGKSLGIQADLSFRIQPIGHLAVGTNSWQGGLAVVGENGPELVNLPRGSQVHTADETKQMLGSIENFNVYISGYDKSPQEIVDEIKRQLAYGYQTTLLGLNKGY